MKVLILAGGMGTRLAEETSVVPKPMVEIGGHPILWHIMKIYSHYGFNEFIILLGYKGYVIKEYFANYFLHQSDVTFDLGNNSITIHEQHCEPWKVTLIDTGLTTQTGGRVLRARKYIGNEPFMLTYGDGLSTVNLRELERFHRSHGKAATITTVNMAQLKGVLEVDENNVITSFREKDEDDGSLINGGFMMLNPEVFSYIEGDDTAFEKEPMAGLLRDGQLMSFYHEGFWQCMDTQREMKKLNSLWESGEAPWKIWKD